MGAWFPCSITIITFLFVSLVITNWKKGIHNTILHMAQFWSGKLLSNWDISNPPCNTCLLESGKSNGKPIFEDLQNPYGVLWCLMGFFVGFQRCLVPRLISQSLVRPKESASYQAFWAGKQVPHVFFSPWTAHLCPSVRYHDPVWGNQHTRLRTQMNWDKPRWTQMTEDN